jgi:hypothetical protein
VVEHDVEDDLDAFAVGGFNEALEHHVARLAAVSALIAAVYLREVGGVVAVVVVPEAFCTTGVIQMAVKPVP